MRSMWPKSNTCFLIVALFESACGRLKGIIPLELASREPVHDLSLSQTGLEPPGKVKVKVEHNWYDIVFMGQPANPITETLRYGTHCQGITQFYLPLTRFPRMEWIMSAFAFQASLIDPGGMESWGALGTTTVSIQSVQNRYVTGIIVVSCSNHQSRLTGQLGHRGYERRTYDLSDREPRR